MNTQGGLSALRSHPPRRRSRRQHPAGAPDRGIQDRYLLQFQRHEPRYVGNVVNPSLYNDYVSAANAAVAYYETEITNPITVTINFGWGEVANQTISGAVGESSTFSNDFTYAQVLSAAQATDKTSAVQRAAVATLPATDPTDGATFEIATAEQKALGLTPNNGNTDGSVGLNSSDPFSWSQTDIASKTYDAVGTLEHEISEVLGREDDVGANLFGSGADYSLLDMFRYTSANGQSAGARDEPFVTGYDPNAPAYFSYNGTTVTLPYNTPGQGDPGDWATSVSNDSFGETTAGKSELVSVTDLQELNVMGYDEVVACYLPDTQIATPDGEVAVQNLAVGDPVLTHSGHTRTIVWIGRGNALATRGRRNAATPVIVRKHALAFNVPNYDLRITKGHALYVDDVLIPAEFLVNHRSILWDDDAREVTVYHIELDVHDVLIANGAPAESYRDDGNRWLFQNRNTGWRQPAKPPYAPVLTGGPIVDAVWQRLLARSGPRPGLPQTDDPDLHLTVNGRRVDGFCRSDGVRVFRLPPSAAAVLIVSRAAAPDELGVARDPRPLGVAVRKIVLWHGPRPTIIEAHDPRLSHGFHAYEAANGFRWTNGDAVLPASLLGNAQGLTSVDLHLAGTTRYLLIEDAVSKAA